MIFTASNCKNSLVKIKNSFLREVLRNERTFLRNELEFLNATHFKILTENGDYLKKDHLEAFDELKKFRATAEDEVYELTMPLKLLLTTSYQASENYDLHGASWIPGNDHSSFLVIFWK